MSATEEAKYQDPRPYLGPAFFAPFDAQKADELASSPEENEQTKIESGLELLDSLNDEFNRFLKNPADESKSADDEKEDQLITGWKESPAYRFILFHGDPENHNNLLLTPDTRGEFQRKQTKLVDIQRNLGLLSQELKKTNLDHDTVNAQLIEFLDDIQSTCVEGIANRVSRLYTMLRCLREENATALMTAVRSTNFRLALGSFWTKIRTEENLKKLDTYKVTYIDNEMMLKYPFSALFSNAFQTHFEAFLEKRLNAEGWNLPESQKVEDEYIDRYKNEDEKDSDHPFHPQTRFTIKIEGQEKTILKAFEFYRDLKFEKNEAIKTAALLIHQAAKRRFEIGTKKIEVTNSDGTTSISFETQYRNKIEISNPMEFTKTISSDPIYHLAWDFLEPDEKKSQNSPSNEQFIVEYYGYNTTAQYRLKDQKDIEKDVRKFMEENNFFSEEKYDPKHDYYKDKTALQKLRAIELGIVSDSLKEMTDKKNKMFPVQPYAFGHLTEEQVKAIQSKVRSEIYSLNGLIVLVSLVLSFVPIIVFAILFPLSSIAVSLIVYEFICAGIVSCGIPFVVPALNYHLIATEHLPRTDYFFQDLATVLKEGFVFLIKCHFVLLGVPLGMIALLLTAPIWMTYRLLRSESILRPMYVLAPFRWVLSLFDYLDLGEYSKGWEQKCRESDKKYHDLDNEKTENFLTNSCFFNDKKYGVFIYVFSEKEKNNIKKNLTNNPDLFNAIKEQENKLNMLANKIHSIQEENFIGLSMIVWRSIMRFIAKKDDIQIEGGINFVLFAPTVIMGRAELIETDGFALFCLNKNYRDDIMDLMKWLGIKNLEDFSRLENYISDSQEEIRHIFDVTIHLAIKYPNLIGKNEYKREIIQLVLKNIFGMHDIDKLLSHCERLPLEKWFELCAELKRRRPEERNTFCTQFLAEDSSTEVGRRALSTPLMEVRVDSNSNHSRDEVVANSKLEPR